MAKLKNILQEVFEDTPKVDKHKVIEGVRNFGIVGKSLYNNNSVMEVAKQLSQIAESAHSHILGENDDWFDKISVNKNMKHLKGSVMEFQKTAKEAHQLNQRLTGLYEDIGHVLNRYYDIDEAMDAVGKEDGDIDNDGDQDSSDEYLRKRRDAIGKSMKKEDKGDMDNDGKDEPDEEEYMDNKDKAIKKAMGKTQESLNKKPIKRLKDIGNVSNGIPALGDMIPRK
tara:strand:+ start:224 stop:901 length:678 start_codon:yes stop_codon:yes gene_type:complete